MGEAVRATLAGRLVGVLRAAGQHLGHERPHCGLSKFRATHISMLPSLESLYHGASGKLLPLSAYVCQSPAQGTA